MNKRQAAEKKKKLKTKSRSLKFFIIMLTGVLSVAVGVLFAKLLVEGKLEISSKNLAQMLHTFQFFR